MVDAAPTPAWIVEDLALHARYLETAGADGEPLMWSQRDVSGHDLSAAVLAEGTMFETRFADGVLRGADLSRAVASGADFSRCQLEHADFFKAALEGARFEDAAATGARFARAEARRASFAGGRVPIVV